jgi:hypothetical protein
MYHKGQSRGGLIYDREQKEACTDLDGYFNDIVRFEAPILNKHMNYLRRTTGLEKHLENYLDDNFFKKYLISFYEKIIYKGRFLKQKEAYQIIQNSSERPTTKTKLISFLVDINSDGATNVKEENSSKYIRMIKKLNCLDINPMLIPSSAKVDSFENPIHKLHGITPQEIRRFPSRI